MKQGAVAWTNKAKSQAGSLGEMSISKARSVLVCDCFGLTSDSKK